MESQLMVILGVSEFEISWDEAAGVGGRVDCQIEHGTRARISNTNTDV